MTLISLNRKELSTATVETIMQTFDIIIQNLQQIRRIILSHLIKLMITKGIAPSQFADRN